jgi:hypothetical protein
MALKTNLIQCGWSYGNGDDQYDNESLGSTRNAVNLEKSVENSVKNSQNEYDKKMCSKQEDKYTNEQGWTIIDANSKCKPKCNTGSNTTID